MSSDEYHALAAKRRGRNTEDPSDDSSESLSQLVTAIGPKFESTLQNERVMDVVFVNVEMMLQHALLTTRFRFMLMDLQELRAADWIPRKPV